ncbi:MAG: hypothetical protein AB7I59_14785 [Geminicoccaceae bacterium]
MAAGGTERNVASLDRAVHKMIWMLLATDLALITVFLTLSLSGYSVEVLAIGLERSIPNWYSAAKLLILAQLLAFVAWQVSADTWRETLVLLAPALLFMFMSVEEVAAVRDRFERALVPADRADVAPLLAHAGNLLSGFVLVVTLAAIAKAYARIVGPSNASAAKAVAGVAIFLLGAVGVELVFDEPGRQAPRIWPAAAEEGAELVGVTILIWAAAEVATPHLRAMLRGSAIRSG